MHWIYGFRKISWQHTVCSAHFTFNKIDSATDIAPWRQVCTQMLSCVLICLLYVCMCIANPPACVTITHLLRGKEMPLLYNSVNTQVCNGFHDLLGGTQWFVFGSGAIDYMAKGTNDLLGLTLCGPSKASTPSCFLRPAVGCNSALSPVQGLVPRSDEMKLYRIVCTRLCPRMPQGREHFWQYQCLGVFPETWSGCAQSIKAHTEHKCVLSRTNIQYVHKILHLHMQNIQRGSASKISRWQPEQLEVIF